MTVVSGGRPGDGLTKSSRAAANAVRAAASPRGRHVVAEKSGHYVPITEAGVIVEEIRRLALPG